MTDPSKTENGEIEQDDQIKENANGQVSAGPSKLETNGIEKVNKRLKEGHRSDGAETTQSQSSTNSKKSKSSYDKLALSRNNLKDVKLIGRGEFGDVMIAKIGKSVLLSEKRSSQVSTSNSEKEEKELVVLVKSLTQNKDEACEAEFKREIEMFSKLSHENVSKLYGLCREMEPHYIIFEHTDWGDLKQFLVATQKGNPPPLTSIQCVAILHQLSRGMDHLSASRFIHRDLAARNCLVSSTLIAKIGMPRLIRDPYSQEYCKHVNQVNINIKLTL